MGVVGGGCWVPAAVTLRFGWMVVAGTGAPSGGRCSHCGQCRAHLFCSCSAARGRALSRSRFADAAPLPPRALPGGGASAVEALCRSVGVAPALRAPRRLPPGVLPGGVLLLRSALPLRSALQLRGRRAVAAAPIAGRGASAGELLCRSVGVVLRRGYRAGCRRVGVLRLGSARRLLGALPLRGCRAVAAGRVYTGWAVRYRCAVRSRFTGTAPVAAGRGAAWGRFPQRAGGPGRRVCSTWA